MENLEGEDADKQIICITNVSLAEEVINHVIENENRFKKVLIFDLNDTITNCNLKEKYPEIVFDKTNRLYILA